MFASPDGYSRLTFTYTMTSVFHLWNEAEFCFICLCEEGGWLLIPLSSEGRVKICVHIT